jgi:hypothetical protein
VQLGSTIGADRPQKQLLLLPPLLLLLLLLLYQGRNCVR